MATPIKRTQIADILRRTPGIRIIDLADKVKTEPESVLDIINSPDFKEYLKHTETAHLHQLRSLHQIAFDRIAEILDKHEDLNKVEALAKWLLTYTTDSILKVSEISGSSPAPEDTGNITINQILGRDPFARG